MHKGSSMNLISVYFLVNHTLNVMIGNLRPLSQLVEDNREKFKIDVLIIMVFFRAKPQWHHGWWNGLPSAHMGPSMGSQGVQAQLISPQGTISTISSNLPTLCSHCTIILLCSMLKICMNFHVPLLFIEGYKPNLLLATTSQDAFIFYGSLCQIHKTCMRKGILKGVGSYYLKPFWHLN